MSIVETVRQALLVFDTDLRILITNSAFYRTFQVPPPEADGELIYALSCGPWNLPGPRESLEDLTWGANSFPDYEVEQLFPVMGHRSLVLGGCRVNHLNMIPLAVDDIAGRN